MVWLIWLTVVAPALWAGLLFARFMQGAMALLMPALLDPAQMAWLHQMTPALMIFGLVLAVLGNLMMGLETGFLRWKKMWLDNLLVFVGAAAWLLAALLQADWWLPLAGQGVAALLMAPQIGMMIANMCIKGDAFFVAIIKLIGLTMALLAITAGLGWLNL